MNTRAKLESKSITTVTESLHTEPLSDQVLEQQNHDYQGSGGTSTENKGLGFMPAFMDMATGAVLPSRYADGSLAPVHILDGLPDELIIERHADGSIAAVKDCLIPGFIRCGLFYTRDQACEAISDSMFHNAVLVTV